MQTPKDTQQEMPEDAPRPETVEGQSAEQDEREREREIGGVDGPEPTRYGDWERNGRCTDF